MQSNAETQRQTTTNAFIEAYNSASRELAAIARGIDRDVLEEAVADAAGELERGCPILGVVTRLYASLIITTPDLKRAQDLFALQHRLGEEVSYEDRYRDMRLLPGCHEYYGFLRVEED